ncbi:hypothetical protein NW754_016658 [Fusarium falciforme]|nr:hypothetical protein NW754_016658 [Fusarium falciforme]
MQHPEYEHYWNWEMDMRYLGSYYEFFDRLGKWAKEQPRTLLWERSARYYIPPYHGTWENFSQSVQHDTLASGRAPIFGPLSFEGKEQLRHDEWGQTMMPPSCSSDAPDRSKCGVGEDADIITLNPLFDTEQSGWVFSDDATGYKAPLPDDAPSSLPLVSAVACSCRCTRRCGDTTTPCSRRCSLLPSPCITA